MLMSCKMCEKMKPWGFASPDFMPEVKVKVTENVKIWQNAYKHSRYKTIWLKSLRVMSSVTVFAMQKERLTGQSDDHDSVHRSMTLIWIKNCGTETATEIFTGYYLLLRTPQYFSMKSLCWPRRYWSSI